MRVALILLSIVATYFHCYITMRRWLALTGAERAVQVSFAMVLVWVGYGVAESMRSSVPIQSRVFFGLIALTCLVSSLALDYNAKRRLPPTPPLALVPKDS